MFKIIAVGALALLAACAAPRPRPAAPPCADGSAPDFALTGTAYRVDESQSELRLLVYRAGAMARLGHNHVLVNRALCGAAGVNDTSGAAAPGAAAPGATAFWLKVPVARFTVDDAQARSEEGTDFAAAVPDDAKSGTLQHMLGTSLLDADEFPTIIVRGGAGPAAQDGSRAATPESSLIAKVSISVAGHESVIEVPVTLRFDADRLLATGRVDIRQTALGLTPYSLMLGALQVQDLMTIKFKIAARRIDSPR